MKVGTDQCKDIPKALPIDYRFEAFRHLSQPFRNIKVENPSTQALAKVNSIIDGKKSTSIISSNTITKASSQEQYIIPNYINTYLSIKSLMNVNRHPCEFIKRDKDGTTILNQDFAAYKIL